MARPDPAATATDAAQPANITPSRDNDSTTAPPADPSTADPSTADPKTSSQQQYAPPAAAMAAQPEEVQYDDFGLPIRKFVAPILEPESPVVAGDGDGDAVTPVKRKWSLSLRKRSESAASSRGSRSSSRASHKPTDSGSEQSFKDAASKSESNTPSIHEDAADFEGPLTPVPPKIAAENATKEAVEPPEKTPMPKDYAQKPPETKQGETSEKTGPTDNKPVAAGHTREQSTASAADTIGLSEFSHQALTAKKEEKADDDDGGWQTMPSFAAYDMYDDDNRLVAKEFKEEEDDGYGNLGGAGKGYTRVLVDDDAESATSMDENTQYLFKNVAGTSLTEEEEEARDAVSQMQATKDLLTEGQRVAYVGLTRLEVSAMVKEFEQMEQTKKSKKEVVFATEAMKMWAQKTMIRVYAHMEINADEQVMIEQLSAHGVRPEDLTPALLANSRVKNPMADEEKKEAAEAPSAPPKAVPEPNRRESSLSSHEDDEECAAPPPPPYEATTMDDKTDVQMPSQMTGSAVIDIDLRWTVLCDLFLVLIADSIYDSRSRYLLERVGKSLEISWLEICRFEKKVTDALEMQQQAEKENWNEEEHMDTRRKLALKRRYVMMGLATVGGGLVIGLSAGLLAPLIGGGLVAGFAAIGVGQASTTFLVGAGGTAIIASSAAASGSFIGVRAANRRTGSVKTFEYRPLHNNKRVNLIITVSGWMTGKVDDVRLPFSTVDSLMGDIYSILWEPELLRSMGDTINILATEALTQGLQQVLASTFLTSLMAALTLPVVLTKLSYLIDNPWAVSQDRAWAAGLILADSLIDRNLGTRPVTLVGYSLGSRVIFSCLLELARKGALGLVQNVYIFGSPVVVKHDEWLRIRTVVSGRFVSGYSKSDWILGYLFRLTNGGIRRVAGLAPVEGIPRLENMDVSEIVQGHMDYRAKMPRLLRECGWIVENDEFTEIEDPDPENHAARQRELINEIEEARKELEKEGKASKGGWLSFGRKKKAPKRKDWEIYEDQGGNKSAAGGEGNGTTGRTEDKEGNNHGVLFDIEAIRAELAKEAKNSGGPEDDMLQVKELKSTLPPMKLDIDVPKPSRSLAPSPLGTTASSSSIKSPRDSLRETRSASAMTTYRTSHEYRIADERSPSSLAPPPQHRSFSSGDHGNGYQVRSPYHGRHDDDLLDEGGDGEIQMTFDTSFDEAPARRQEQPVYSTPAPPPLKETKSVATTAATPPASSTAAPTTKSQATPAAAPAPAPAPPSNPWANFTDDDDDPEFGKEEEISMTFA